MTAIVPSGCHRGSEEGAAAAILPRHGDVQGRLVNHAALLCYVMARKVPLCHMMSHTIVVHVPYTFVYDARTTIRIITYRDMTHGTLCYDATSYNLCMASSHLISSRLILSHLISSMDKC